MNGPRHTPRPTLVAVAIVAVLAFGSWASAQRVTRGAGHGRGRVAADGGGATADAASPGADAAGDGGAGGVGASGEPDAAQDGATGGVPPQLLTADTPEARRQRAGEAFLEGMAAYRRGDYAAAAQFFETAYQTLPDPAPLFNMARAYEGANDIPRAIQAYDRYLASAPNTADRAAVLDRLARLRSRPVQIFMVSEPPGAALFLDDQTSPHPQVTPTVLSLSPGDHAVVLDRDGYRRTARRFTVRPGVTDTVTVELIADPGSATSQRSPRTDPRILNRRSVHVATPRFSLLMGGGRALAGRPFVFSIAGEASLFIGRSFTTRLHFERLEPDGVFTNISADVAFTVPIEDLDLSIGAHFGVAIGPPDASTAAREALRLVQPLTGIDLRLDWQFHPFLSFGIFLRGALRIPIVAGEPIRPELLNSFGASISLTL